MSSDELYRSVKAVICSAAIYHALDIRSTLKHQHGYSLNSPLPITVSAERDDLSILFINFKPVIDSTLVSASSKKEAKKK